MQFGRFIGLIGQDAFDSLQQKKIFLAGVGGVGSYVFEALIRSGMKQITIVDQDTYDITNLNRQLNATLDSVGRAKVEVCKEHASKIHPEAFIQAIQTSINDRTISTFGLQDYDYIIDCIDTLSAKVLLLQEASKHQIPIIHSMGFANKLHPEMIRIAKLNQTSVCPLAKEFRRRVKLLQANLNPDVVYSTEVPLVCQIDSLRLASSAFTPSSAGLLIASHVINQLLKESQS